MIVVDRSLAVNPLTPDDVMFMSWLGRKTSQAMMNFMNFMMKFMTRHEDLITVLSGLCNE